MDNQAFKDALPSVARQILDMLKANMADEFKAIYYGDPVKIPQSLMPCIIVDTLTTQNELGPTQFDKVTTRVIIKLVFNKKDDFNGSPDEALTKEKCEFYMEGRDKETGKYIPASVQGILRTHLGVEDGAPGFDSTINYDIIIRPEESLTQEAHLTTTIVANVQVPNRD